MSDAAAYLELFRTDFFKLKETAEKALAQAPDARLHEALDPDGNSLAVLVRHLAGNLRSRWTDFLTSDGEKPGRNRDAEFAAGTETRAELLERWEAGWTAAREALDALRPADFSRTVTIAGKPHSVLQALQRQLLHASGHVGQIVLLARHWAGPAWRTLSVPRRTT